MQTSQLIFAGPAKICEHGVSTALSREETDAKRDVPMLHPSLGLSDELQHAQPECGEPVYSLPGLSLVFACRLCSARDRTPGNLVIEPWAGVSH